MSKTTTKCLFGSFFTVVFMFSISCDMYNRMQAFKVNRYETGKFKGAESCEECHKEIYDQWKSSVHAIATKDQWFLELKDRLPCFPNKLMMGDKPCYACHGPKTLNEGVSCEVCHGINDRADVMDVHKKKYTLNLADLRKAGFCGKCHEAVHPKSNEIIMTTMQEWKNSQAAKEGKQCIDCHTKRNGKEPVFHGFSSRRHDISVYENDLEINNFRFNFPDLSLDIENKITGHYLPTGAPESVMFLKVELQNSRGETIHSLEEVFKAIYATSMGFPAKLLSDNRLRDCENRTLRFTAPEKLKGQISTATVSVKFYDVDFIYTGDINKARWESAIFYSKTFSLAESSLEDREAEKQGQTIN